VVATKRSPGKRPTSSGRGRGSSSRSASPSRKARPKGKAAPPPRSGLGPTLRAATDGHRADLAGLCLIALGVVSGLGIYADRAGIVGHGLTVAAATSVGPLKALAPLILVVAGVLLVRGRQAGPDAAVDPDAADEAGSDAAEAAPAGQSVVRRSLGAALLVLATLGLLDLARGAPRFDATRVAIAHAGGFVGVVVGEPLRSVLSTWGAASLLVLLGLAGLVLLTGVTIRRAAGATAEGVRPAGNAARRALGSMFRLEGEPGGATVAAPDGADDGDLRFDGLHTAGDTSTGVDADAADEAEADGTIVLPAPADPAVYDQDLDGAAGSGRGKAAPAEATGPTEQLQIDLGPAVRPSAWKLPPLKLLSRAGAQSVDRKLIEETGRTLEHALAEHGVETRLVGMTVGPTVTRYELELGPGVKVAKVTSLHKDIAYAMATPDVRILAPIPGRQAIGVEVPNVRKQLVTVGDILASEEARKATHPLEVAIGRDIAGKAVLANLATMPHVLIAGATGAGKSSCINSLMTSILMRSTPDQVRLILVDPKRVELGQYNGLPHLLTDVVTSPKKAANALAWAVREMERRYDLLSEVGVRDIAGYNAAFDRGDLQAPLGSDREYARLPFILIVVDELNDLMMVAARDVEESITRIAQMARAVGLHLVVATQRPSVNVITGVIKANIPARWAFAVSSLADSRVILDQPGAEKLLGKGDMLLLGPASSIARRIQGSWVTEDEVRAAVAHWKRQAPEVTYDDEVQGTDDGPAGSSGSMGSGGGGGAGDDDDDLLAQARELVVRSQLGSTSMLQRKLRVGFARAGRLMDLLEQQGVVGPSTGSKSRTVLMTVEELDGSGTSTGAPSSDGDADPYADDLPG
jgi:S-DNA-T family DNA segregation ATPase FtsK/SpoIIIE